MSAHILLLALGGLLIVVAILGGGIEARELRIPQIGKWPRVLAGLTGMFFFALGIGFIPDSPSIGPGPPELVTFKIRDELGEGQVSEQVRVLLNGKEVGYLNVNQDYPASTISVSVPSEGVYSYVLEARAFFRDENKQEREFQGSGQGNIEVRKGKIFDLVGNINEDTWQWQAHLEEVEQTP
jgi:hypothetical protein